MYRSIIYFLLITSLAAATPSGRQKRHFSYLRNLFNIPFFRENQRTSPQLSQPELETEYELYEVPGFDDILVKAIPSAPIIEETMLTQPEEVFEINPFESYIGTKSPEETLVAFRNVNNLLATEILDEQKDILLKDTMVPMISGLNIVPKEAIIRSDPVTSKTIQPSRTYIEPFKEDKKLSEIFEPRFLYKQMGVNQPDLYVTAQDKDKVLVKEKIDLIVPLPPCIDERIEEVITLGANPYRIKSLVPIKSYQVTHGQYPDDISRLLSAGLNKPLKFQPFQESAKDSKSKTASKKASTLKFTPVSLTNSESESDHNNHPHISNENPVISSDKIDVTQTLGPIPPQYISKTSNELSNKTKSGNIDDNMNNSNIDKTKRIAPKNGTISRYVYKQATHDNPNAFSMVKEGNQLKTNTPPAVTATPIIKNTSDIKPTDLSIIKNKDNVDYTEKPVEKVPKKGTLSSYIYEHVNQRSKPFSKVEADQPKRNSPHLIRYVFIPRDSNRFSMDSRVPDYVYNEDKHTNRNALTVVKNSDHLTTNVDPSPMSSQYVFMPPNINSAPIITTAHTDHELFTNKVTENPIVSSSTKYSDEIASEKNSLKNNPIVVADSKYTYHKSNLDGSSISVTGTKDGVAVNRNEKPSKDRGDIPDEEGKLIDL